MSTDTDEKAKTLLDQKQALQTYLNALLVNAAPNALGVSPVEKTASPVIAVLENQLSTPVEEKNNEAQKISQEKIASEVSDTDSTPVQTSHPPKWAENEFTCLRMTVAGLNLLVPSKQVVAIREIKTALQESQLSPEWIKGFLNEKNQSVRVINTRKMLFRDTDFSNRLSASSDSQLVLIGDGSWGLCCDEIGEVVKVKSNEVVWRTASTSRRWLAGTSRKWKSAVLDVQRIAFYVAMERPLV